MIPVLWLSYHYKTPNKGYWDMGLLEHLFEGTLYQPAIGYEWDNQEVSQIPDNIDGAVIVLPARYHVNQVTRLNNELSKLQWVLLILANDEESLFPREKLKHPNMLIYVMTPRPEHDDKPADMYIGEGFPKDAKKYLKAAKKQALERKLDYFFSGQITHSRRKEMVEALDVVAEFKDVNNLKGEYITTAGFTQGLPHIEYYKKLASAKAVPCPSGPATPDSFRLFEALEAGAVPIADDMTPTESGANVKGYWRYLFADAPFPIIENYEELQGQLIAVRDEYPKWNNRVFAWWQNYKRNLAKHVVDDVFNLSGAELSCRDDERNLITVIVPTSVIPSHPDTAIIEETISTIRTHLPDSEIIITIDGLRAEQQTREADYDEYIMRLLWLCNHEWHNVLPLVFSEHTHQAGMARRALELVETPAILYVEHDTPIAPDRYIDWQNLFNAILYGYANVIRLHHEELVLDEHKHMMFDTEPQLVLDKVPMMRTMQWSQRPHLASTAFYKKMLDDNFHPDSKTMIEDVMHGVVHSFCEREGINGWQQWRLYMYTPNSDSLGIKRSYHLDGRANDPKYDMQIKKVKKS